MCYNKIALSIITYLTRYFVSERKWHHQEPCSEAIRVTRDSAPGGAIFVHDPNTKVAPPDAIILIWVTRLHEENGQTY